MADTTSSGGSGNYTVSAAPSAAQAAAARAASNVIERYSPTGNSGGNTSTGGVPVNIQRASSSSGRPSHSHQTPSTTVSISPETPVTPTPTAPTYTPTTTYMPNMTSTGRMNIIDNEKSMGEKLNESDYSKAKIAQTASFWKPGTINHIAKTMPSIQAPAKIAGTIINNQPKPLAPQISMPTPSQVNTGNAAPFIGGMTQPAVRNAGTFTPFITNKGPTLVTTSSFFGGNKPKVI